MAVRKCSRALLVCVSFATFAAGLEAAPPPWKPTDSWKIDAHLPAATQKFNLLASVAKDAAVAGKPCWQLALFSDSGLPDGKDVAVDAFIDKKSGWPIKVAEREPGVDARLLDFAGRRVVAEPLAFFPVELFAMPTPGEFTTGKHRLAVRTEKSAGKIKVNIALFENDAEAWRVEQIWSDGGLFWESYQRHENGRLTLTATAAAYSLAKRSPQELQALALPAAPLGQMPPGPDAESARQIALFAEHHPLVADPALCRRATVPGADPTLPGLLDQLAAATKRQFTLADNLTNHNPDFGGLDELGEITAYRLMEIIAENGLDDGRWEKTEGGYRLTGTPRTPQPGRWRWLWLMIAPALALAAGAAVVRYRRGKQATAPAKGPPP